MIQNTLLVRPFAEADEPSVVALWNDVFPEDPPRNEPRAVIGRKLRVQREEEKDSKESTGSVRCAMAVTDMGTMHESAQKEQKQKDK